MSSGRYQGLYKVLFTTLRFGCEHVFVFPGSNKASIQLNQRAPSSTSEYDVCAIWDAYDILCEQELQLGVGHFCLLSVLLYGYSVYCKDISLNL